MPNNHSYKCRAGFLLLLFRQREGFHILLHFQKPAAAKAEQEPGAGA